MKARARTALGTGFLLVVLAGVAAVAWFGVHRRGEERARHDEAERKVLPIAPERVTALRVRAKGDDVRLVRADAGWRIEAPVQADADAAAVKSLLDTVAGLERRSVSAASGASGRVLRPFGLDAPAATLELTLEDGHTERLLLGDTTGFDGAMFVMPTDGRVMVVSGEPRRALELGLADLKAKPSPAKTPSKEAAKPVDGG